MANEGRPITQSERGSGASTQMIGDWVLGEELFPAGGVQRTRTFYLKRAESGITTTYAKKEEQQ